MVVNTARGDLVDDDALIDALQSGKVAAAGLDVLAGEPNLDPRYRDLDNTFLLPHIGSASLETRDAMGYCCLDNLDAFFAGRTPASVRTRRSQERLVHSCSTLGSGHVGSGSASMLRDRGACERSRDAPAH